VKRSRNIAIWPGPYSEQAVSEATPHTAACEQLLDYVYDMLDEPQKGAFEEHLATCARCQAEAASFGKVRQATARLMPAVEPPAALTGALHAQLMHAAAQRKPARGKLLSFPRRVMQHPAWAAAAMFVIVGSAITLNAVRGKLMMPMASAPALAPQPQAEVAATPAESPPSPPASAAYGAVGAVVPEEKAPAGTISKDKQLKADRHSPKVAAAPLPELAKKRLAEPAKSAVAYKPTKNEQNDDLKAALGGKGGLRSDPAVPPLASSLPADSEAAPHAAAKKMAKRDALGDRLDAPAEGGAASDGRVALGGQGTRGGGGGAAAKSSAPAGVAHLSKEEERSLSRIAADEAAPAPAGAVAQAPSPYVARHRAAPSSPLPAAAPATAAGPPPVQVQASYGYNSSLPAPKAAAPQQQAEDLHQRADDLVRASRCDEAVKLYAELDRRAQRMSPKERANYVRCLTATGRQQAAEQQLDELKADKSVTNGLVQQAEGDVQSGRRGLDQKSQKPKAARKSLDADRESSQQPLKPPADVAPTAPAPAQKR
jgi:anti-sigma factor RsiW